eukprot:Tbor_TRINITY_DN5317_c3_g4::TRINITY_DN5317_c3_g4_i4::g.4574::m.4574
MNTMLTGPINTPEAKICVVVLVGGLVVYNIVVPFILPFYNSVCAINARRKARKEAVWWINLGISVGSHVATIDGVQYTAVECFTMAVKLDESYSEGWHNLGNCLKPDEKAIIKYRDYSKRQCYIKALELDASNIRVWTNLGKILIPFEMVTVNHKFYTAIQCYTKAVELDDSYSEGWTYLGNYLKPNEKATVKGVQYTAKECYTKARATPRQGESRQ